MPMNIAENNHQRTKAILRPELGHATCASAIADRFEVGPDRRRSLAAVTYIRQEQAYTALTTAFGVSPNFKEYVLPDTTGLHAFNYWHTQNTLVTPSDCVSHQVITQRASTAKERSRSTIHVQRCTGVRSTSEV